MGGAVVSETDEKGRKVETNVYAAGTTLAVQVLYHNDANNTTSETVRFNHTDASGLSYRSTLAGGAELVDEGGDGSPAELDAAGGNVGAASPYITLNTAPPDDYDGQQKLFTDTPQPVIMLQKKHRW